MCSEAYYVDFASGGKLFFTEKKVSSKKPCLQQEVFLGYWMRETGENRPRNTFSRVSGTEIVPSRREPSKRVASKKLVIVIISASILFEQFRNFVILWNDLKLIMTKPVRKGWSETEKKKLGELFENTPIDELKIIFKRGEKNIRSAAQRYGFSKSNRYWSEADKVYLMTNWETMTSEEIAEKLGKTKSAVDSKMSLLKKENGRKDKEKNKVFK